MFFGQAGFSRAEWLTFLLHPAPCILHRVGDNSKLKTQNSKLKTLNSELCQHAPEIETVSGEELRQAVHWKSDNGVRRALNACHQ